MFDCATANYRSTWLALLGLVACLGCGPTDPLSEVRELQVRGRYEESLEPLRELLVSHPDVMEVHYRYGVALGRLGQPDQAVWSLRKAGLDPTWAAVASLELATAAVAARNWQSGIEAASRVIELEPENVRALALRAEARLGELSEPELALVDLDRALELDPEHVGLMLARARALLMTDRVDEATEAIAALEAQGQKAELSDQILGGLCVAKASVASAKAETAEAEALFGECLGRYPTNPTVVDLAVDFFDGKRRPDQANAILRAVLEQAPQALRYRKFLAERLRTAGNFEASERVLREGLSLKNTALVTGALAALAEHYVALDNLDAAVAAYEQALTLVPEPAPLVVLTLADLLARAGRHAEALDVAKGLESDAYRALIEARVHLNEGRPAQVLERLTVVFPTWPDNPGARYYAARASEQLGLFDRAIEEYRQSIRSGPSATDAGLRLAKLHVAEGADASAWSAIAHHRNAHPGDPAGAEFVVRLASRTGPPNRLQSELKRLQRTPLWPRAVAVRTEVIGAQSGPEAALGVIRRAQGLDLSHPHNAPLLRALVVQMIAAGTRDRAQAPVEAALAAHPESADFHEVQGLLLERDSPGEAQRAYQRALEQNPKHVRALEALGRLAEQAGDAATALSFYDRATAVDPDSPSGARRAALLVTAQGREGAEARWEAFLREHPWDAEGALALARLRLARDLSDARTLELARRSLRFRGGTEARRLLAQVHTARGETEEAAAVLGDVQGG